MMCCRYVDDILPMHRWCIDDDPDNGYEVMIEVVMIKMMGTIMMRAT